MRWRIAVAAAATLAVFAGPLVGLGGESASAASGGDFQAGNIISDSTFYNANAMTSSQIQGFLDSKVAVCGAGYTCLENYRQDTVSRPADAMCSAYTGVRHQAASEIIHAVAQACGVNPQVLIVLLEKEQGLVSSTHPTSGRYDRATGYACPDTAPCDEQYFGFYNQVYKAAWQYQVYRLYPSSFGYRAGRVNGIYWHPDKACGSSQVYIENQATAGLYIYTPYRPNAAALNNMYGTGDACSSYGNRNFWRIFTDWFGDPRGGGSFAKTADNGTIYLLTADSKYAVPNPEVLTAYWALGPYRTVSSEYLSRFTTGPSLGALVRDPTTGEVFYSDRGIKHHVLTCEQLLHYATECSKAINLTPTQILLLSTGSALTQFAHSVDTGAIYYVNDGTKRWMRSMDDVIRLNRGTMPQLISLGATALHSIPTGPDYLGTGSIVRVDGQSQTYLVDTDKRLVAIPPAFAGEFGGTIAGISGATLTAHDIAASPLTLAVTCGDAHYIAGGGQLWPLTGKSSFGLPTTALNPLTCNAMPVSKTAISGPLFVRSPNTGDIFYIADGQKRHVISMNALHSLNGGPLPTMVPLQAPAMDSIKTGVDILAPTQLVKSASSPVIYLVDGPDKKTRIDLFETAAEFGISGYSVSSDALLGAYRTTDKDLTLAVTCGSKYYVGGGGRLWALTSQTSFGLPTTALHWTTCAVVPKAEQTVGAKLFLRSPSTGAIYSITDGKKNHVSSMGELYSMNGGTMPTLVPVSDPVLARLPG